MDHYSNYNGFNYRDIFWGNHQRDYEDAADKNAIKKIISPTSWLLDLGGGFGRLIPSYQKKIKQVILLDGAIELLQEAALEYQEFSNINLVCAKASQLPFRDGSIDAALLFRMLHCINEQDLPQVFQELERVVRSTVYLEFANKRNLFRILRYLGGNREINIFTTQPERINNSFLNFTFPYIKDLIYKNTSFKIEQIIRLSFFRNRLFKKFIPLAILLALESALQNFWPWNTTPSILLKLTKKIKPNGQIKNFNTFQELIICPDCHYNLNINPATLTCLHCQKSFPRADRIINFRA